MKAEAVITLLAAKSGEGAALAEKLGLAHVDASSEGLLKRRQFHRFIVSKFNVLTEVPRFFLVYNEEGLGLLRCQPDDLLEIRANFHSGAAAYRRLKGGGKNQMIAKAVGIASGKSPTVLDATAGLGRDAFVLASLGCSVTLVERVDEVHALLEAAIKAAVAFGGDGDSGILAILQRMEICKGDALEYMAGPAAVSRPDVVYLDPMFPPRNKSAQIKKEMQVFHELVGRDPDTGALLRAALSCAKNRVVVKRPRIAPPLDPNSPTYSLEGKSNRFDVYVC